MKEIFPASVTVLPALIFCRSKTMEVWKREETFPPPCLSLLDGRLRGKSHTHAKIDAALYSHYCLLKADQS